MVWSAGGEDNVKLMVDHLTSVSCIEFDRVIDRRQTEFSAKHPFGLKDMQKVYATVAGTGPRSTFVVDDTDTTFSLNPDNALLIPAFVTNDYTKVPCDVDLLVLMSWLNEDPVVEIRDVRTLFKTDIFDRYKTDFIKARWSR